ncbi:hypothetical protein PoB_006087500 [Plakobranchus ocellatus]|uniref:Uncharacterized protein n=1 Tax=Plakobranchus ocellatus TaxID=259542 RepID=A0AAV4CRB1_9GAST|nr:hypothetical protein PoB_006087500 [Plakobranchus ocellatus]
MRGLDGKKKKFKPLSAVRKLFGGKKRKKEEAVVAVKARSTTALHSRYPEDGEEEEEEDDDGGDRLRPFLDCDHQCQHTREASNGGQSTLPCPARRSARYCHVDPGAGRANVDQQPLTLTSTERQLGG